MITNRPRMATPNIPVRDASGEYRSAKVVSVGACLTNRAYAAARRVVEGSSGNIIRCACAVLPTQAMTRMALPKLQRIVRPDDHVLEEASIRLYQCGTDSGALHVDDWDDQSKH